MILNIQLHVTRGNSTFFIKKIAGSTKKLGANYAFQKVCVYSRITNQLIAITESDKDGNYELEVYSSAPVYVVALDSMREFNAVIQDNVVPK